MNQISVFEYVSILESIIIGLGITQILTAFSNLLYNFKSVKFYFTHTIWILFTLFLLIQDWFITYQLKDKLVWTLPEVLFVLLYPIVLYVIAKILLPDNDKEESISMEKYYYSQSPTFFFLLGIAIVLSIVFNLFLLKDSLQQQAVLMMFLLMTLFMIITKNKKPLLHKLLSAAVLTAAVVSTILNQSSWIIK